ncbi:glycine--tRNA ligase subunit beta [Maricaulis sp.]|uniref:glycine--tRNA ligase subunit beta n=1 Tax=Maricaulis sp. TaxID=1486257 RepID=UPI001B194D64|nr:glycine--tRNA ligase subunit beta [Maricaulis sp.]MBO6764763.1 glycine--tRNA ligase subunit beta [Maricaulis sp.]
MSELLFEIFCEEIPARMQPKAEADLERLLGEKLTAAGLAWSSLTTFAGPRRLGLAIDGLPVKTEDVREERKGPRVGAPDKAVEGFLRGAGVDSLDACEKREDKKGEFWVAIIEKPGRATAEVIAEAIPEVMKAFPWPKSMKFGEDGKAQRWVRPIQRLLCLFDGQVVDFEVYGIKSGNLTEGHRRMGRGPFEITDFAQYTKVLREDGHVIQQREEREAIILDGARRVCAEAGLELVEDPGLLTEVAGLVEWPVPLLGEMDPDFLDLPPEVITLTMKTHQKYFAVKKPGETGVTSKFVVIANQVAPDGGKAIAAGNARVLSARLSDARHFWDNDRKTPLDEMAKELSKVTFHEKLGTVADKVERVAALARELAPVVGADADLAEKAARLAKADLVSEMVYEFPELQGAMGRYYALDQGEDAAVADAIKDHYKPQGPSDEVPTAPVSAAVALADKLDTLVGFWAIDEKPTGSKDPFALRRAALGVIRILLEGGFRLGLTSFNGPNRGSYTLQLAAGRAFFDAIHFSAERGEMELADALLDSAGVTLQAERDQVRSGEKLGSDLFHAPYQFDFADETQAGVLAFFADRLKVHLRDEGIRYDVIDAVFALGDDDLVRVTAKARALQAFLDTEDGAALLAGYNRASNIVRAEEKKDGEGAFEGALEADYLAAAPEDQERALIAAVNTVKGEAQQALVAENFEAAMAALATLRAPIDAFFEHVTVNSEDAALRRNRLFLLSQIRTAVRAVADFDRIAG